MDVQLNNYKPFVEMRDERMERGQALQEAKKYPLTMSLARSIMKKLSGGRIEKRRDWGAKLIKKANYQIAARLLDTQDSKKLRVLRKTGWIPRKFQIKDADTEDAEVKERLAEASDRYDALQAIKHGKVDWIQGLENAGKLKKDLAAMKKMNPTFALQTPQLCRKLDQYIRVINMTESNGASKMRSAAAGLAMDQAMNESVADDLVKSIQEDSKKSLIPDALAQFEDMDDNLLQYLEAILQKVVEPSMKRNQAAQAENDVKTIVDQLLTSRDKAESADAFDANLQFELSITAPLDDLHESWVAVNQAQITQAIQMASKSTA